jgi:hypothetical protein
VCSSDLEFNVTPNTYKTKAEIEAEKVVAVEEKM